MSDRYVLVDGVPKVENDLSAWASWYGQSHDDRVVARDDDGVRQVSTVFLALDYQFGDGPPILYETMVFGDDDADTYCRRYSTREEAEIGHREIVESLKSPPSQGGT